MLVEISNQECLTGSLNGPSLLETLRSLSPEEAVSTDTYEGYSAWNIALHVLYFKQLVAVELGASVPDYVYQRADFPSWSGEASREAWDQVIADIEATHKGFIDTLSSVSEETLEREHKAWKMPLRKSIGWVIGHDTCHNAQIRSMGLPSLRQPVEE